jgi:hypothetical protein
MNDIEQKQAKNREYVRRWQRNNPDVHKQRKREYEKRSRERKAQTIAEIKALLNEQLLLVKAISARINGNGFDTAK